MIKHQPVKSSVITSIGHDPEKQILEVKFKNGKTYTYDKVSEDDHAALIGAESVGRAFNEFKAGRS